MADEVRATRQSPDDDAPVLTPEEINRRGSMRGPGVDLDNDPIGAERQPRLGTEDDEPDSDALGG